MSQWSMRHPEQMAEIAALPLPGQRAALADAQRQSPSQERAETLRNASRVAEEEREQHDDLRKDAEDDIAIEAEKAENE